MKRLTARRVATLKRPGRYSDGHGLMLFVQRTGRRSWVQRITLPDGCRVDRGLGSVDLVSLAQAREWALANKIAARRGEDPFTARRSQVPTFRSGAAAVDAAGQWRGRTRDNRRAALEAYAGGLMDRRVDRIGREDVLGILSPIWTTKAATARRLRGWLRGVLAWAQAHGYVEVNYAGEMISGALPTANGKAKQHRAALPYGDVAGALVKVDASATGEIVKAAIRFLALTAVRSGEARGATWQEIDLDGRVWRIPASRMKTSVEHRVPLSDAAVDVLRAMERHRGDRATAVPLEPYENGPGTPLCWYDGFVKTNRKHRGNQARGPQ